jgi:hypothetical protein
MRRLRSCSRRPVGPQERPEVGAAALRFRAEPRGSVRLPADIVKAGAAFDKAMEQAVLSSHTEDDGLQGHSMVKDHAVRAIRERFVVFAARDLSRLRSVLRDASDASERALAARVIAYNVRQTRRDRRLDPGHAGSRDPGRLRTGGSCARARRRGEACQVNPGPSSPNVIPCQNFAATCRV